MKDTVRGRYIVEKPTPLKIGLEAVVLLGTEFLNGPLYCCCMLSQAFGSG